MASHYSIGNPHTCKCGRADMANSMCELYRAPLQNGTRKPIPGQVSQRRAATAQPIAYKEPKPSDVVRLDNAIKPDG